MGKRRSKDDAGEAATTGSITSLFAADNPFRRKPQPHPPPQPQELPLVGSGSPRDANSRRNEKRDKHPNPNESELPLKKKKKKTDDGENATRLKKRKRDVLEEEYERRRYGAEVETTEEKGVVVGRKRKAEVGVGDMVAVRRESFDDESKLLRTVFVGNLPFKTKKKLLLKEFATFGEVESARIRSVPIADTTAPRKAAIIKGKFNDAIDSVHAYIVFKDELSARAALAHNMVKLGGNHIRVDMACPPRKKMKGEAPIYSVKKTVFIGNLPFDVKDEELYQLFCQEHQMESSVEAVRVIRDPQTSMGKGIAYVMFKTREAANSVVKKRSMKLRDRELRLSHAKPDSTPSKRKIENQGAVEYPNKRTPNSTRRADHVPKVTNSSLSYQGLRSSKLGMPKRVPRVNRHGSSDAGGSKPSEGKIRKQKRPAVAARKANTQKQVQKKRKVESDMQENLHRNKRARHFP